MNFLAAGVVVVFQGQEIETFDRAWHGILGSIFFMNSPLNYVMLQFHNGLKA